MTRGWGVVAVVVVVDLITLGMRLALRLDPRTAAYASFGVAIRTLLAFGIGVVVAALILRRHPRHAVGLLLLAMGTWIAVELALESYARYGLLKPGGHLPGDLAVAWVTRWLWIPMLFMIGLLLLVFPDGRPPTRRWRWVGWAGAAGTALLLASFPFLPGRLYDELGDVRNPLAASPALVPLLRYVGGAGYLLILLSMVLAAASLVVRWRRGNADQRRQLAWIALAVTLQAVAVLANAAFGELPALAPWVGALGDAALIAVFTAIGVAVLRYRLFDVELVLNRALAYGTLVIVVTALYVGVVVGLGRLLGQRADLLLSALATAGVAVLFAPVRSWSQRWANRVVYGEERAPFDILRDCAHRLAAAPAPDEVLPAIAHGAATGVGAAWAEVRLRLSDGSERSAAWPEACAGRRAELRGPGLPEWDVAAEPAGPEHVSQIRQDGAVVGQLAVTARPGAALTRQHRRLLDALAAQSAPALRNVRLTGELTDQLGRVSAQAAELRASRQRLSTAQTEERRRIERDLHDGAQQQLVAVAVRLRLAAAGCVTDPAGTAASLDEIRSQVSQALAGLRDLARGVFPSLLADAGIGAALGAHIARTAAPARLDDQLPTGRRFDREVEAAVYFGCLEALQNVTKHAAAAQPAAVRLRLADGGLTFEVRDGGRGFDPAGTRSGSGLAGMADRLAAVGGTLTVDSAPGKGTAVHGTVPV